MQCELTSCVDDVAHPGIKKTRLPMREYMCTNPTLLSHTEWARIKEKAPKLTLDTHNLPCLRTYSGHSIRPLGRTLLDVYHNDTHYQLYALIVPGTGPNLLGRDWLSVLQLNWAKVHRIDDDMFLEPYKDLFSAGLGKLEGVTAKLYVDETATTLLQTTPSNSSYAS